MKQVKTNQPFYILILLILSGEAVFILPFVLQRVFRPTFLEVFNINNTEIGYCFSIYGIVALFSYLFGGPLADKFHPRYLMSAALILTALGGIYLSTFPNYTQLKLLFGYWGFTTIFLFWSSLIKATRIWGGTKQQGLAFGFLDGGRGLVAAGVGSLGVFIFSFFIDADIANASFEERQHAFRNVILISSAIIALIGLLVFYLFRSLKTSDSFENSQKLHLKNIKQVLKIPSVWLLMIIVLCAYLGYKVTDIFPLYASNVMDYDAISSAKIGASLLYIRPIVGVLIGFLADRTRASLWLSVGFLFTIIASIVIASGIIEAQNTSLFILSIGLTAIGVYTVRVLYFAVLEEGKIPLVLTGTVVGLISVIGFTPDIFSGPLIGLLLDNNPGKLGHQYVFSGLAGFAFFGLIASILFYRLTKK